MTNVRLFTFYLVKALAGGLIIMYLQRFILLYGNENQQQREERRERSGVNYFFDSLWEINNIQKYEILF